MVKKLKKKPRRKRCEECGKLKEDAEEQTDPYVHDVYGEDHKMVLCGECYYQRVMDI